MVFHSSRAVSFGAMVVLLGGALGGCGGGGGGGEYTSPPSPPAVDTPPVVVTDEFQANRNQKLTITVASILANDHDSQGRSLIMESVAVSSRAGGTITRDSLGDNIDYLPPTDYLGVDEFTYIVSNGSKTASGNVLIKVRLPDAPLAQNDVLNTQEDQVAAFGVAELLQNDLASNVGEPSVISVTGASDTHGTVVLEPGFIRYTPERDYFGTASFLYTISDGVQASTGAVTVLVTPVNDAPFAQSDEAQSQADVPVEIALLANDSDIDGDSLKIQRVDATSVNGGSVRLSSDNVVIFIPSAQAGRDRFTYTIVDGSGAIGSAEVAIDVVAATGFNEAAYAFINAAGTTSGNTAEQAFDEVVAAPGNGWVADQAGSRLAVRFDQAKRLHKIVLTGRVGGGDSIRQATITFSDGTSLATGVVANDGIPSVFYFKPRTVTGFDILVNEISGPAAGLSEVTAFSALTGQVLQAQEPFHDLAAPAWTPGAEFDASPRLPVWAVTGDVYQQSVRSQAQTDDAFQLGAYSVWTPTHADMDLRLRLRVDRTEAFEPGVTGVLFGFQDGDNFYRFTMSRHSSYHRLEKKVGGVFTELAHGSTSLPVGEWVNVRVVHDRGVIIVQVNGRFALGAVDTTFAGGKVALWNSWAASASYDKVSLFSAPPQGVIGFTTRAPFDIVRESIVMAQAIATQPVSGVEFVADEGLPAQQLRRILLEPFRVTFDFGIPGTHSIKAYSLDSAGNREMEWNESATLDGIGVLGKYLVGVGDSITNGVFDNVLNDDASIDGRTISGGYQALLNNRLTQSLGIPVTVLDESTPGDKASNGVTKIDRIASKHAQADAFLIMYGTNDTEAASQPNFDSAAVIAAYKAQMRTIVTSALGRAPNAKVFMARIPPIIGRGARNNLARSFNTEIGNLIAEFATSHPGRVFLGPDFFAHFNSNQTELDSDGFHPNGVGYQSMGALWFDAVSGKI